MTPTEARLSLALQAGQLGVWEWTSSTDTIVWDAKLEDLFGLEPGTAPQTFDRYLELLHPDDRDQVAATIAASLASGEDFEVNHRVECRDGTIRWIQGRGRPLYQGNEVIGMVGVSHDDTGRHEAEEERTRLLAEESSAHAAADAANARLEFIAEATAAMSDSVDLNDRLQELSRLSIPRFADGSAVHLLDESGVPRLIALHHSDAEQIELIRELLDRYPVALDNTVGIGAAIRDGRGGWLPAVTEEMLQHAARSDDHLAMLRRLDISNGLVVPLIGTDGPFGALTFVTTEGRTMSEDDLELVEQLSSRIAVLVRNAHLIKARELDRAAYRYQAALLQSVFEASVDGILAVGPNREVLAHNQRFLQLWELDEALTEQGDEALLAEAERRVDDREGFAAGVRNAYADRVTNIRDEVALANGRVLDRYGTCLSGPDGEYLGFLWSFRDVTLERAQTTAVAEAGERSAMLARTLQQSLLPPGLPRIRGIDLAARYHAAFEGLEVGGDFYDVFAVGDEWILVVGDVCGKGAEAAALTALARYTIRASANRDADPCNILIELNAAMLNESVPVDGMRRFATVCCVRLRMEGDWFAADVACGGHHPPLVLRNDHSLETPGSRGTLLGIFDEVDLKGDTVLLGPGDSLIVVTDGVLEARDANGALLEASGLEDIVRPLVGGDARRVCEGIESAALEMQGGVAHDDIAILVARIEPD